MSNSTKDDFEQLASVICDEATESLISSGVEMKFSKDFHPVWETAVRNAVNRMQSEQRVTDQDVQVARTTTRIIIRNATQNARYAGRLEIEASDFQAGIGASGIRPSAAWPWPFGEIS